MIRRFRGHNELEGVLPASGLLEQRGRQGHAAGDGPLHRRRQPGRGDLGCELDDDGLPERDVHHIATEDLRPHPRGKAGHEHDGQVVQPGHQHDAGRRAQDGPDQELPLGELAAPEEAVAQGAPDGLVAGRGDPVDGL